MQAEKGKGVVHGSKKGKRMKELAVLKWLKEGCYSMGFAHIFPPVTDSGREVVKLTTTSPRTIENTSDSTQAGNDSSTLELAGKQDSTADSGAAMGRSGEVALRQSSLMTDPAGGESSLVKAQNKGTMMKGGQSYVQRREDTARNTRWLAMGSKDGRVSLWDIF